MPVSCVVNYANVPCMCAKITLTAMAETNMPAMMYTKSIQSIYATDVGFDRAV